MSDPDRDTASFSASDSRSLQVVVAQFRKAWQDGQQPSIPDFLPLSDEDRPATLLGLVRADMELRLGQGEQVRVEQYLDAYPTLVLDRPRFCQLIATEYSCRLRTTPDLAAEEYYERFPDDREALKDVFSATILFNRNPAAANVPQRSIVTTVTALEIDEESLPAPFGRFELRSLIGRGGFGAVYLAYDPQLDRQVAVKIPHRSAFESEVQLQRFLREARSGGRLHHANACTIFDVGQWEGLHYIVMAYIEGKPLSKFIQADSSLDPRAAARITLKLTMALHHAHELGIIHRDLKPSNIIVEEKRKEPIILDFGLARDYVKDAEQTQSGEVFGTPIYMSPEQARGASNEVGPKSDIYSLGVVLYEMLTGKPPFTGSTGELFVQILTEDPVPPSKLRPDLAPELEAICLKAMAREQADRYSSMRQFGRVLKEYLLAPAKPPEPRVEPQTLSNNRVETARVTKPNSAGTNPVASSESDSRKIEFICPHCRLPVRTPQSTAGKKGQCPNCQSIIVIPQRISIVSSGSKTAAAVGAKPNSIIFNCPHCSNQVRTPQAMANKRGKCPSCQSVIQIPAR